MTIQTFLNDEITSLKKDLSKSVIGRSIFIIIVSTIIICLVLAFLCVYNTISCSNDSFQVILTLGITLFVLFCAFIIIPLILCGLLNMCFPYVPAPSTKIPRWAYTPYVIYQTRR